MGGNKSNGKVLHPSGKQYHGGKTIIVCNAQGCGWAADPDQSQRLQREAHRSHRRDMGEEVIGRLRLETSERASLIRELHGNVEDGNVSCTIEGAITRGPLCLACHLPWPCLTWRLADGQAEAADDMARMYQRAG